MKELKSDEPTVVIGGVYEHYKGQRYRIIAIARHSETLELLVVYQALYNQEAIWVRPLYMFLDPPTRFRLVAAGRIKEIGLGSGQNFLTT